MFHRCQRQWYFKTIVANARAKDPVRREAYLLSKLQSIPAWRGSLVDHVISHRVVSAMNRNWPINPAKVVDYAKEVFQGQLEFALHHRLREPGLKPSKVGSEFAAFHAVEYGQPVNDETVAQAWIDVERALGNLFRMGKLFALLTSADYLISQRGLTFPLADFTVRAFPDLIAFFSGAPPLMIDWKVHTYAASDYRFQLACYAIALKRCKPHKDFPNSLSVYSITDIRLMEVQLLADVQREYALAEQDTHSAEDYIVQSATQMNLATGGRTKDLSPSELRAADQPSTCECCSFRSLCWEN